MRKEQIMKNYILVIIVILLPLIVFPSFSHAQWMQTNGPTDKKIHALATIGTNFFAGTDSGVFYTSDKGLSWAQAGLKNDEVMSLAVIDTDLFAATDSGVMTTTNNGTSWTKLQGVDGDLLWANGTNLFAPGYNGVYRSTDRGANWTFFNNGLSNYYINDFATIGTNIFAATQNGVCRSTDSGESWVPMNQIVPMDTFLYVSVLAAQGTNLFAGTGGYGVFLSTDSGNTWSATSNEVQSSSIYALMSFGSIVFAGTGSSFIFQSTDTGKSWDDISIGWSNPPFYTMSFAVIDSVLFAGTDTGVWRCPFSNFTTLARSAVAEPQKPSSEIQSYPNPFSQSTTIAFTSPESGAADVSVVNILGAQVARIFSGQLDAGEHTFLWDMPPGLSDGMYECVVNVNGNVQRISMAHLSEP
jgi:photosystem II stability/assembly factor-like uncharacterized protein